MTAQQFQLPDIPELHATKVVLVHGALATNIKSGKDYDTISLAELLTIERTNVPKASASFIIGSSYHASDARVHSAQREHGVYHLLYADLDEGNVIGRRLAEAVQRFVGNALFRIYPSSSATEAQRKWRVIIPLKGAFRYPEWRKMQVAMFRFLEQELQVPVDYALERSAQPVYLPNTAPRTDGLTPITQEKIAGSCLFEFFTNPEASDLYHAYEAELAEQERQHAEAIEQARRRMALHREASGGQRTVIEAFNEAHDVEDLLTAYGYQRKRNGWRSRYQTSESYATKVFHDGGRQFWISRSESDLSANVGRPARSGGCSGDAFDLFCHYEHGNDQSEAIKAAAARLGMEALDASQMIAEIASKMRQRILERAETFRKQEGITTAPAEVAQTPFDLRLLDAAMQEAMGSAPESAACPKDGWPEVRLDLRHVPAVRWLIDDCIAHSLMTVAGAPGTGKTTVLLSLLLTIAGFKVMPDNVDTGIKSTTRRKVLIVSEDLEQIQRSLAGYCKRFGFDPDEVNEWVITIPAKRASVDELLKLAANVERHTVIHPRGFPVAPVLVLDTASATWDLDNENDNSEVARYVSAIKETIHNILDAPVLVVTHTPKNSGKAEDAESRGASAFRGDFRTTGVVFSNENDPDMRYFRLLKKRFEPLYEEIAFRSEVLDEYAEDENGRMQVVRCRISIPIPMTADERRQQAAEAQDEARQQFVRDMSAKLTRAIAEDMEKRGAHQAFIQVGQHVKFKDREARQQKGMSFYDRGFIKAIVPKYENQAAVRVDLENVTGWKRDGEFLVFTLSQWQRIGGPAHF